MAEYAFSPVQTVLPNQPVILDTVVPCNKGYVYHRDQSGILILRGAVTGNGCFARYQVTFNGNIAIPDGGTAPAGISVALAIDGEPILTSRAIVTPADTAADPPTQENLFNVTSTAVITVPKCCCFNVAVENTSESSDPATTPAPAILVRDANLTVSRIA